MTPTRPYFLRALYDWIVANDCTPYLSVDATVEGVQVPEAYVEDGEITLNLSVTAIIDFFIDDEWVSFKAKFNGIESEIFIPMSAVLGVYAKESGQGMLFPDEPAYQATVDDAVDDLPVSDDQSEVESKPAMASKPKPKGSHLKVIK